MLVGVFINSCADKCSPLEYWRNDLNLVVISQAEQKLEKAVPKSEKAKPRMQEHKMEQAKP